MSSIPAYSARVPTLLASQLSQTSMARTSAELLTLQAQMAAGKQILRPSDDPAGASIVSILDARIGAAKQRDKNFAQAKATLATMDQALGGIGKVLNEARTIALEQVSATGNASTRDAQAEAVGGLIDRLVAELNRDYDGLSVFAGNRAGVDPIEAFQGGYRYAGAGKGLRTDLGMGLDIPVTIGADAAIGALSARVKGAVDLDPKLASETPLADLRGARGQGVAPGTIRAKITGGTTPTFVDIDLADAKSVADVAAAIDAAIRKADPGALDQAHPAGVRTDSDANSLLVDAAAGYSIEFQDVGNGVTAQDLGLQGFVFTDAADENTATDLDPALTEHTRLASTAADGRFGDIVLRNGPKSGTISVDADDTVADLQAKVEGLGIGLRLNVGSDGRTLELVGEVAGWSVGVEESGSGSRTATALGIRSLHEGSPLTHLNNGKGVEIADGDSDPAKNVDFTVTLTSGATFDVDLVPEDLANVKSVLDAINKAAADAGFGGVFKADLGPGANGVRFVDSSGGTGATKVAKKNGRAAEDLGLLDSAVSAGSPAILAGEDRAKARVDSALTTLIELRDALRDNDPRGIGIAGKQLEKDIQRLSGVRGAVAARTAQLNNAKTRSEDAVLLNKTIKSGLEDLDYTEAATRFSALQLLQKAAYSAAASTNQTSLLNFLK